MNSERVTIGTVSHGTMRPEDLIPAFFDELQWINPEAADDWRRDHWPVLAVLDIYGGWTEYMQYNGVDWALEALFDALNEVAPEGVYFGGHEGDGADYGFWLIDSWEDDYDDDTAVSENPYGGPGGLLDEFRQAERLIGTV